MERNNIPYINVLEHIDLKNNIFYHCDKVIYYLPYLNNVKTKYVLILDAYDVLILTFEQLIEKFTQLLCHILYNACTLLYPYMNIEATGLYKADSKYLYLNSGVCIGETDYILNFYKCIVSYRILNEDKTLLTEQYYLRYTIKQYQFIPTYVNIDSNNMISLCTVGNDFTFVYKNNDICLINEKTFNNQLNTDELLLFDNISLKYLVKVYEIFNTNNFNNILDIGFGNSSIFFNKLEKLLFNLYEIDTNMKLKLNIMNINYIENINDIIINDILYDLINFNIPLDFKNYIFNIQNMIIFKLIMNHKLKNNAIILYNNYYENFTNILLDYLNKYIQYNFEYNLNRRCLIISNITYNEKT